MKCRVRVSVIIYNTRARTKCQIAVSLEKMMSIIFIIAFFGVRLWTCTVKNVDEHNCRVGKICIYKILLWPSIPNHRINHHTLATSNSLAMTF